uniref:Putative Lon protease homolog n=1 Tax=Zeugodacus cucurbitae TaxID=28588 RepID=A0A0A1XL98_ZEUCU
MKLSEFKTLPVVPYTNVEICGLPFSIQVIIQAFATKEALSLPRSLTQEYMNCTGLGYKLLNNDWSDYIAEFPWLIAVLIYSTLLPIICLIWCIFQFRSKRVRRFERSPVPSWRYILSTLLFLLKILYSFFIWFTYTAYQNHPTRSYREPESNVNMVKILYDQTLDVIDHISTENIEVVQEFMKKLADEMISSLNDSAPELIKNLNGSMLLNIQSDSVDIQPILKELRKDMQSLLADIMQLTDLTRLFQRNTTTILLMSNISDPTYINLLNNEVNANKHKIITLLNIERVLSNIEDIVTVSIELPALRQAFAKSLEDLHNYYGSVLTTMWAEKVNEMNANYLEIIKAVKKLRTEVPRDVMIHLPNDIYSYQLFFLIIAIMISVLCWMQLCYAVYHAVSMRFKKRKYILVSIVVVICITSIILCLIASLSFFLGTSFFNFRQDTSSLDNPCGLDSKSYCDSQNKILSLLAESAFGPQAEIYNAMQLQNQRVFETLRVALPSAAGISNILQMLQYADFSGTVFSSGNMFNVMKQEMNMENLYAVAERLSTHVPIAVGDTLDNKSTHYESMLACNLQMMKTHVFETLISEHVVENVNGLSQNAQRLAALLPITNLTTLLRKSLSEMRILHDYFEIEFKDLLNSKMQQLLMDYDLEMMLYTSHVAFMPNCRDFKMSTVGIPRQLYECIESCLHGFWIGAFSILILLFPILIICMLLAYLYDRYPYSTQSGASSGSTPPPEDDASRTSSTGTVSDTASVNEPVNETTSPKSTWKDKFGMRRKRSHVTFDTPPSPNENDTTTNKLATAQRSSTAKIRDLIYSILKSAPSTTAAEESKLSGSTTTSEESSEGEPA